MAAIKKTRFSLLLALVFYSALAWGQDKDSLSNDSFLSALNVSALHKLAKKNIEMGNIEQSIDYAQRVLDASSDPKENGKSLLLIAKAYHQAKQYKISLGYYIQAAQTYEKIGDTKNMVDTYIQNGLMIKDWGVPDKALELFLKANKIIDEQPKNYPEKKEELLFEIADSYFLLKNYKKALPIYKSILKNCESKNKNYDCLHIRKKIVAIYDVNSNYQESLKQKLVILDIARQTNDKKKIAAALNNVGYAYRKIDDRETAVKYLQQSLDLAEKNEGKIGQDAIALTNVGVLQQNLGNYNASMNAFKSALVLREKENNNKEVTNLTNLITKIYIDTKNFYEAKNANSKAIEIAENNNYLEELKTAYNLQNSLYQKLGESRKALNAYELYASVKSESYRRKVAQKEKINNVRRDIERIQQEEKLSLADKERKQVEVRKIQLESENLKKQQALDSAKIRESELEREQERLARIKAQQDATLALQKANTLAKEREVQELQQQQEIQQLQDREKQTKLEKLAKDKELVEKQNKLLAQEEILRTQELEKRKSAQLYTSFGVGLLALILLLILGFLRIKQKDNKKLEGKNSILEEQGQKINKLLNETQQKNEQLLVGEEELRQNAEEMTAINEQLNDTLTSLKDTQSQLVQSEKMASLGQLVAGVAHEVNTPLGAIKASIGTISDSLDNIMDMLPKLYSILDRDQMVLFNDLLRKSFEQKKIVSSREERSFKRAIRQELQEQGVEDANGVATMLIDIGVYENIQQFTPLITHEEGSFILKCGYYLALQRKNSNNISLAVKKASKVVFALKSYSRHDHRGEMVEADIVENIETVLTLYHNQFKQGIEINKHFDKIPKIYCYADELSQVWTNLITNGVQAMNNQGKLDIDVKNQVEVIKVSIRDYGIGIPKEIKHRIFDPFFTTKKAGEGTGLGLDIVKKIVEKHGGQISVESEEGKGTVFTVQLPVDTKAVLMQKEKNKK